jgi:TrmH family RNA methyltransferase
LIERITSHHNPRIKKTIRLHSSRGRQSQGRIIVFGTREVIRAIGAGVEFEEIFFADSESEELVGSFEAQTDGTATQLIRVDDDVFSKIAYGDRIDGVVGVATRPETKLERVDLHAAGAPNSGLVMIVQAIEKPGNIGAIVRTADACGVAAMICADPLTDVFHPNSIRASTGTVFNIALATSSSDRIQCWLHENEFHVFTARLDNATDFFKSDLTGNVAIVVGNEAKGLDEQWSRKGYTAVKLPMKGEADSLNVSVTASVMMYEAMRQKNHLSR